MLSKRVLNIKLYFLHYQVTKNVLESFKVYILLFIKSSYQRERDLIHISLFIIIAWEIEDVHTTTLHVGESSYDTIAKRKANDLHEC